MSLTVIIPHFYRQRQSNLLSLTWALNSGTMKPDEILIWNNDLPFATNGVVPLNTKIIQSPRNIGSKARFLAAMCASSTYVLFHDNDVAVQPETLEHLFTFRHLGIVALEGRQLQPGQTYRNSTLITGVNISSPVEVDISLGRVELVSKRVVNRLIGHIPFDDDTIMDDIWFSHVADVAGERRYVVPASPQQTFTELPEGDVGYWLSEPKHFERRTVLCDQFWPDCRRQRFTP